ncbi:MAG: hypothetical protein U9N30_09260, partial [Campylobacterota bacterium]|nr:hypothetical protein [Campylobacterota bacterium]
MHKIDYLKKYNLFNTVLALWIVFLPLKSAIYQATTVLMIFMFIYHVRAFKNIERVTSLLKQYKDILLAFMLIVFSMILSSVLGVNLADSLSQTMK